MDDKFNLYDMDFPQCDNKLNLSVYFLTTTSKWHEDSL
jgi:hypothetical protein